MDEEQKGGAPTWMLTYGDSVTLLVTFFVLLLTFSTPNPEDFQQLATGLCQGARTVGLFGGSYERNALALEQRRLMTGRLDAEGAENAPTHSDAPLSELIYHYADIDVAQLPELKGAVVIRIPLVDLFGTGVQLTESGAGALDHVVRMARAQSYSVIVRVEVGDAFPPPQRRNRSLLLGTRVLGYLRENAADACKDLGLSDTVQLAHSALPADHCEITMLEI
ncbi:MAG: hypothetical protein AMK73_00795 [Planctomycetes bacterium SM23_32]|nr:MAG: hypothetical protein AMK73_00795 [Planctomycetes bacterium SM23_32]